MPDIGPLAPGARPDPPRYMKPGSGSGGVGGLLRKLHIPWPEANENVLWEAARSWYALRDALSDNCARASNAAASLTSNNEGAAIDAFEKYWDRYGNRGKGALPLAAEACHAMGDACTKYGDEVAATKRTIEEAGAEIGATLAIGTIGAFFTFGAAEGSADAVAAGIADYASEQIVVLGTRLAAMVENFSATVETAIRACSISVAASVESSGVVSVLGSGIVGGVNGAGGGVLTALADNEIQQLFGDKPLSPSEAAVDVVGGALAGGTGGLIGKLTGMGQGQVVALLRNTASSVSDSDLELSTQMLELARQIDGIPGKITADVLTKAATQLITAQQVNADKIVQGEIPKLIQRAAQRDEG